MDRAKPPILESDRHLLDTVVYLTSLASDPKVINPLIDIVRDVTAELQMGHKLTAADRKQLDHVRFQLQDHLLHRDPVRQFTPDDLRDKLTERFGSPDSSPVSGRSLREVGYIGAAVVVSFVLGMGLTAALPLQQRLFISLMLVLATMYAGVSGLFIAGLSNLSANLRSAYGLIFVGYIATGLGVSIMPLGLALPDIGESVLRYGVIIPIFIVASLCMYIGTQIFAQTLGVRSFAASRWPVLGIALVVGLAAMALPHFTQEPSELWFDITTGGALMTGLLAAASTLTAEAISRRTTQLYARAMRWFSYAMAYMAIAAGLIFCLVLLGGRITGVQYATSAAAFGLTGILMAVSAYMVRRSSGST